jgi:2-polyprenyl-3-methyl-5-hydroxy-6-metoxy-1,4-benzoquinol methylase
METADIARGYPTGSLRVAACPECGFVWNSAFDVSLNEYSERCEETQGFSPRFSAWLRDIAAWFVDQYDVRGKRVLEIGCGKGEFLELVCELGDNTGIGVDPALVPERLAPSTRGAITAITELWSEEHLQLDADAIVCRHTLEHIAPVRDFVRLVHRATRPDTIVFFELPDVERVLRETAFWDVYYEHCSYFTAGSLAALFRREGFDVIDVASGFDDQYLLLSARRARGELSPPSPLETSPGETMALVDKYQGALEARIRELRDRILATRAAGGTVAIWGAGSKGVAFLTTIGLGAEVAYAVDINPYKWGKFMPGTAHEVVGPGDLVGNPPDLVVLMNDAYTDEVRRELSGLGLAPIILAL